MSWLCAQKHGFVKTVDFSEKLFLVSFIFKDIVFIFVSQTFEEALEMKRMRELVGMIRTSFSMCHACSCFHKWIPDVSYSYENHMKNLYSRALCASYGSSKHSSGIIERKTLLEAVVLLRRVHCGEKTGSICGSQWSREKHVCLIF